MSAADQQGIYNTRRMPPPLRIPAQFPEPDPTSLIRGYETCLPFNKAWAELRDTLKRKSHIVPLHAEALLKRALTNGYEALRLCGIWFDAARYDEKKGYLKPIMHHITEDFERMKDAYDIAIKARFASRISYVGIRAKRHVEEATWAIQNKEILPDDLSEEGIGRYMLMYGDQERMKEVAYRAQRPPLVLPTDVNFKSAKDVAEYEKIQQAHASAIGFPAVQFELRRKKPPVEWEELDFPVLPPEHMIGHGTIPKFWEAPLKHTQAYFRTRRASIPPIYATLEPDQVEVEEEFLRKKADLQERFAVYLRNPKYADIAAIEEIPLHERTPEQQQRMEAVWEELGREAEAQRRAKQALPR